MTSRNSREVLSSTLAKARRRIYFQSVAAFLVRLLLVVLPVAALAVASDQYWNDGAYSFGILATLACITAAAAFLHASWRLGTQLHAAVEIDERADLRGRISSAWEFLHERGLDEARLAQVRDAVEHARSLEMKPLFRREGYRFAKLVPALGVVLALSFLVPPKTSPPTAEAAVNPIRELQLSELKSLQDDLQKVGEEEKDLGDVLKKLKDIEKRFQQGEIKDRDVMIELARLDENLTKKMAEMGVENLANEVNQLLPHLSASQATQAVAQALKEEELDKAAEEMDKVAQKAQKGELSEEDKKELALNMGVAASKLGTKSQSSFGGDFAKASEAMKSGDNDSFSEAGKSIGSKMKSVDQHKKMQSMRKRISLCKSSLGQQSQCSACNGSGCKMCNGKGKKPGDGEGEGEGGGKGGLKAGTKAAGNPLGDGTRLADSYRELVKVTGTAGEGPVESEVEVTEGKTSDSQIAAKEMYEEYAAVAEQAIEREEIPLSHRFHVKRYFQAIRPAE